MPNFLDRVTGAATNLANQGKAIMAGAAESVADAANEFVEDRRKANAETEAAKEVERKTYYLYGQESYLQGLKLADLAIPVISTDYYGHEDRQHFVLCGFLDAMADWVRAAK